MNKSYFKKEKNSGITLIALVITIIVLLILAGVTIGAITGNESAMEKATESREKDKQGTELEAIKLAVVNSIANDLTGLVNVDNLKEGLNGIVENEGISKMNKDNSPWIVTGKTGMKYKINQNGEVSSAEPVASVEFASTTEEIAISKSKKLFIIAKGASGNVTEANEVTFTSSDEDIATVEEDGSIKIVNDERNIGETVTITVIADGINGKNNCVITIIELVKPKIGDFVNYQAGEWKTNEIDEINEAEMYVTDGTKPINGNSEHYYKFGGYKAGTLTENEIMAGIVNSKDLTVNGNETNIYTSGWRILETDGTYITKIIHAGTPELFYHYNSSDIALAKLSNRNWNVYKDSTFASKTENVYLIDKDTMNNSNYSILKNIGQAYIFPLASTRFHLYLVDNKGSIKDGANADIYGIRPVVILDSKVTVEGSGTTHNTYETRWTLTKN